MLRQSAFNLLCGGLALCVAPIALATPPVSNEPEPLSVNLFLKKAPGSNRHFKVLLELRAKIAIPELEVVVAKTKGVSFSEVLKPFPTQLEAGQSFQYSLEGISTRSRGRPPGTLNLGVRYLYDENSKALQFLEPDLDRPPSPSEAAPESDAPESIVEKRVVRTLVLTRPTIPPGRKIRWSKEGPPGKNK